MQCHRPPEVQLTYAANSYVMHELSAAVSITTLIRQSCMKTLLEQFAANSEAVFTAPATAPPLLSALQLRQALRQVAVCIHSCCRRLLSRRRRRVRQSQRHLQPMLILH